MNRVTPSQNAALPYRAAQFETLGEALDYAARGETGCNFFAPRGQLSHSIDYRELRDRAADLALRLNGMGIERGGRVAIVAETSPDFLIAFFACQYAGLIPVPLPLSVNFGGHDAYVQRLAKMIGAAGASAAISSDELIDVVREAAASAGVLMIGTHAEFQALPTCGDLDPLRRDDPCYIQYSSGSTSLPRGILVSQRSLTANVRGMAQHGLVVRPGDRCTSWLPLYHDMGLVGAFMTALMVQGSIDLMATTTFARRPLLWLKLISEHGGTVSFSPTFGYDLCVRRGTNGISDDLDLSHWRMAGIGGEMIRPQVLQQFADRFAGAGFDARAFTPSYGLAEATLGVTFPQLGRGVRLDHIDREAAARSRLAVPSATSGDRSAEHARSFVLCGRALPGHRVEVRDDEGNALPDRRIGRICVKGPSVMRGYFRNAAATKAVTTQDGWLDTGDMGYLIAGELVITGRSKDLIIYNGRNIWPQDLEWAVEKVEGVRSGDVAAFSVADEVDGEKVVVIVECRSQDVEAQQKLRREIASAVHKAAGVECEVVLASPRSLPFTSSGKLSRVAARADYLDGAIRDMAAPEPMVGPFREAPLAAAS